MSKQPVMLPVLDQCCTPLVRRPLDEASAVELAGMFRALSDPVRLRLLSLIASHTPGEGRGEVCVCDLLGAFDVGQSTISHHLRVLREAGLVDCQRRGTWVYYRPLPPALSRLSSLLQAENGDGARVTESTASTASTTSTTSAGEPGQHRPSVMFVCVHNAGRSQMAAAFLTHLAGDRVQVRSAGSAPAVAVNPVVVAAMREVGIDITREVPKMLTAEAVQASDVVVTMGCGDACPFFPGKRYLDWELPDPAGQDLATVRPIRDGIETRVRGLLAQLDITVPT